jgi:hypothetical protein
VCRRGWVARAELMRMRLQGQPELEKKIRAERYEACERLEDFGIYFNIRV